MLKLRTTCHAQHLSKLTPSCKQLRFLSPSHPWNLPGTVFLSGFKTPGELWNPLSKTVLSKCCFIWINRPLNIRNERKTQKQLVCRTCKYFSQFLTLHISTFKYPWYRKLALSVSRQCDNVETVHIVEIFNHGRKDSSILYTHYLAIDSRLRD